MKLRVGTTASLDNLPFLILTDRGLDRKNGISIETTPFGGGTAIIAGLAADKIDVGSPGTIPLLDAANRGLLRETIRPVAANIFTGPEHPGGAVFVSKSVAGWKDLEGSYIAVNTPVSLGGWAIVGRLRNEGVRKYTLVEIPFENMGLAVAGGNVKAAVMFEPYITQSLLRGDGRLLDWIIGGPPLERIQLSSIVFRQDYLRENEEGARRFLRAYVQATRWLLQNEKQARDVLGKGLRVSLTVSQRMVLEEWRADCRNDPTLLTAMQERLVGLGFLKQVIPAEALFDETLLGKVLEELR